MPEPGVAAIRYYDEPWRRLKWFLPAALLITFVSLIGFLWLLAQPADIKPPAPPLDMQLVEIPLAPPQAARKPPSPIPEPAIQPKKTAAPKPQPAPQPPAPATRAPPNSGNMGVRVLYQPVPEIPEALRYHVMDLVAVARFHVAANGSATVELIQPTPEPLLNSALLDVLAKWRFFPAMENGQPVASTLDIRIPITVR